MFKNGYFTNIKVIFLSFVIYLIGAHCRENPGRYFIKHCDEEIISDNIAQIQILSINDMTYCCVKCFQTEDCSAVAVSKTSRRCVLLLEMHSPLHISANEGWNVYKADWQLVFRGTAGINIPLASTWTGSTPTTNPAECKDVTSTACKAHYRNPMIDTWSSFGVKKLKLELYKGGASVAMIKFDAVGSDSISWFSLQRVLESSWNLKKNDTFSYFKLTGNGGTRTFYIAKHRKCKNDEKFLLVADMTTSRSCGYESISSYPQFLYSRTVNQVIWSSAEFGVADVLAVYVKTV